MHNPIKKYTVIGMGEVLWDMLPTGKVLGGAPVNFAYHAAQLGAIGVAISAVGDDELGREIMNTVDEKGIRNCIAINKYPTSTVGVTLKEGKPEYTIYENVAWDFIELLPEAIQILKETDAVCFGTLLALFGANVLALWAGHTLPNVGSELSWIALWLMAWGDAITTGMLTAIFVAYRPEWLATWSDHLYLTQS